MLVTTAIDKTLFFMFIFIGSLFDFAKLRKSEQRTKEKRNFSLYFAKFALPLQGNNKLHHDELESDFDYQL